ncbi:hypothetical protein [Bdellovibrio bacteriovorus]|uniref:hypothetical protein n=1 Tax=Bdellovibrio bacteriovorus TaxID=959 RepID=UPI0009B83DD1|nr:hypothetical protein [Bdellovibrio bacteriovorus]
MAEIMIYLSVKNIFCVLKILSARRKIKPVIVCSGGLFSIVAGEGCKKGERNGWDVRESDFPGGYVDDCKRSVCE